MFNAYRRAQAEAEELNMIPIMNLFIVLIPFLLAAAAFFQIGVIPTSTPQHTPNQTDVPKTPVTITVNIVMTPEGIKVTGGSTSLTPEELETLSFDIPKTADGYDFKQVQRELAGMKDRYPASNTAVILPHESIHYEYLVQLLDHVREHEVAADTFEPLFPVTVFSQFVPPPPPGSEEAEGAEEGAEGGAEGSAEEAGGEEAGGEEAGGEEAGGEEAGGEEAPLELAPEDGP